MNWTLLNALSNQVKKYHIGEMTKKQLELYEFGVEPPS